MQYVDTDAMVEVDIDGKKITGVRQGEGLVDFKGVFACMKKYHFDGTAAIEYISGENDYEEIADILQYLNSEKSKIS